MRKIILDLEGNDLYPAITVLHCAVAIDIETKEVFKFYPQDMKDLPEFLDGCDFIGCHYGVGFDFPALAELIYWRPKKNSYLFDTLIFSRLLNPDRPIPFGSTSAHSVDAWGKRFGVPKPKYEQWETFDEGMMDRCVDDARIQSYMFSTLLIEAGITASGFTDPRDPSAYKDGEPNWAESLRQEHWSSYIMFRQEQNGCNFEYEKALENIETLSVYAEARAEYILRNIPSTPKVCGAVINAPFKKNGEYRKSVLDWYTYTVAGPGETRERVAEDINTVVGPFSRIDWKELNLNSSVQVKTWLYSIGWVPDAWNYKKDKRGRFIKDDEGQLIKTSPQITQTSLDLIDGQLGTSISERNKANHKRNQIVGLLKRTHTDTLRIPAGANPQGTPTARMKHRGVANIPKASSFENKADKQDPRNGQLLWHTDVEQDPFFGTEMRALFSAPPRRVLVGRDAAGLEFRIFAHYVGDGELIDVILNSDIHTFNQIKAGLPTRAVAKTFIYAFLFGAGVLKLGSIVMPEGTEDEQKIAGAEAKAKFLDSMPKLEALIKGVQKASQRGWLKGLDGRCLMMRRSDEGRVQSNKALNVLCQGGGAVVMTYARIWVWKEIDKRGWIDSGKAIKVLDYHDEETWECDPDISEEVAELLVQSIVEAGLHYKLNIPLDADAQIGKSWAEIH